MALFTPLANFSGYEHCLNAMPTFVHPNGNVYGVVVAKRGGTTQNLEIYRVRPGSLSRELVHTYVGGGVDAVSQIAAGGCIIRQDGSLWAWASAVPQTSPTITKTGFVGGYWEPIPGVDEPWTGGEQGPIGPPGPAGSGGVTLLPAVITVPAWDARSLTTGELVDIPSVFGVPSAQAYLVRYSAVAPLPNVRARAGTQQTPYMLTVNTQVANVEIHAQGWVPGPVCYLSPANGTPVCWFQLLGFSS